MTNGPTTSERHSSARSRDGRFGAHLFWPIALYPGTGFLGVSGRADTGARQGGKRPSTALGHMPDTPNAITCRETGDLEPGDQA